MSLPRRDVGLLAVFLLLLITLSAASPWFLTADNLQGLARHLAEIGLVACAMTFIIMAGGIDLSVGSLMALCGVVFGLAWSVVGPWPAALLALMTGIMGGTLNGLLISVGHLPPLVVTLATMALFRGVALGISQGQPVSALPTGFDWLGQGMVGGIPVQLCIWLAVLSCSVLTARRLSWGRWVRAIGDNERAARFAALPVVRVQTLLYILTGLSSAVAALIFTARVSTAKADAGMGFELEVITAVVLGGTPITGGRGSLWGTFLGVLLLGTLRNGLTLLGVSSVWQAMLAGVVLVATAILNQRLSGDSREITAT